MTTGLVAFSGSRIDRADHIRQSADLLVKRLCIAWMGASVL